MGERHTNVYPPTLSPIASESSTVSGVSSASSTVRRSAEESRHKNGKEGTMKSASVPARNEEHEDGETEDTMKNLRKTFAGIFGETN